MQTISLDIGGSSIKYGIYSYTEKQFLPDLLIDSHPIEERTITGVRQAICNILSKLKSLGLPINSISISTTGSVSDDGVVINAGHFVGYSQIDWKSEIKEMGFGNVETFVTNDGRASAWAEFEGLNNPSSSIAHLVVGTGVGGSTVVKGKLVTGDFGRAGYIGHIIVSDQNTMTCSCGRTGCVETMASAPGIAYNYSALRGYGDANFSDVVAAYENNDQNAIKATELAGKAMGQASAILMNILNPTRITIGGGVILAYEELANKIGRPNPYLSSIQAQAIKYAHKRAANDTEITVSKFGNDGGLLGAALLHRKSLQ